MNKYLRSFFLFITPSFMLRKLKLGGQDSPLSLLMTGNPRQAQG